MAHFDEHCRDCERILGDRCEEANLWMDSAFDRYGPRHRFDRHHDEGINKAEELFGEMGRRAAIIHVLKDCGHIPTRSQWNNDEVDSLGMNPNSNFVGYWDPDEFKKRAVALLYLDEARQKIVQENQIEKYRVKE